MPSQLPAISLYWLKSPLNCSSAFLSRRRLTLLFKTIGPVIQIPFGTSTTPPPFLLQSSMAALMLSVLIVCPSDFAPYFRMLKVSFLNFVDCAFGKLAGCAEARAQRNAAIMGSVIFFNGKFIVCKGFV